MIRAATWFCAEHCGLYVPGGKSWTMASPAVSVGAEVPVLIGRPVKYYSRMTSETRVALCAARIALKAFGWEGGGREIGLISAGYTGCLRANTEYFHDYVANGRTLGRGNLFIYTLNTSALGEIAIALSLTGPCMFIQDEQRPVASLGRIGAQMISDDEADGMFGLWSDPQAAVCLLIEKGQAGDENVFGNLPTLEMMPRRLCEKLHDLSPQAGK